VSELTETAIKGWAERSARSFDFNDALNGAGWRKALEGAAAVSSHPRIVVLPYRARKPFHPERLWNLLQNDLAGVFRAKGFFWLATRMDEVGGLNLAGSDLHCSSAGKWWATRDEATRLTEMPERTRKEWQDPFGDRRQSFVIMGLDVNAEIIKGKLDACLLTDSELAEGETNWATFADPFPSWSPHGHVHHHDHDCGHEHGEDHDCCHR
jgi:G3E family GTPase